jgi:hypothetical protein
MIMMLRERYDGPGFSSQRPLLGKATWKDPQGCDVWRQEANFGAVFGMLSSC